MLCLLFFLTCFLLCVTAECHSPIRCPVYSFLQVYNADGEFLFKFGSHGEGNGQFNAPTGVAVDANGNIIVADWGNSRIQVSLKKLHLTEWRKQICKYITHLPSPFLCAV